MADDLEAMGPTYVKLGQVFSGRPDFFPEPYLKALARLQDMVEPFSYEEVEEIVFMELNVRITSVGPLGRLEMSGAPLAGELFKA